MGRHLPIIKHNSNTVCYIKRNLHDPLVNRWRPLIRMYFIHSRTWRSANAVAISSNRSRQSVLERVPQMTRSRVSRRPVSRRAAMTTCVTANRSVVFVAVGRHVSNHTMPTVVSVLPGTHHTTQYTCQLPRLISSKKDCKSAHQSSESTITGSQYVHNKYRCSICLIWLSNLF